MQLEPLARLQKHLRHPGRCQPQQAAGRLQCGVHMFADILFDRLELLNRFRSNSQSMSFA